MDRHSRSASEAARELGTNAPRLLRHAEKLGLRLRPRVERGVTRLEVSDRQLAQLRQSLGALKPTADLSRVETQVLTALAHSPRGLLSMRAIARRAGVSPTAAASALHELEYRDLIARERQMVALGRAREVEVIRAKPESRAWSTISEDVAATRLPAPKPHKVKRVPAELKHLFWNTAPTQLDVDKAGGYIARRLIETGDVDGLAWGADHLSRADWKHAAVSRGLDPRLRALASNLAEAASH